MSESRKKPEPEALSSEEIARIVVAAADDKHGHDIQALCVRDLTSIADYFVLISATSTTQVNAIYEGVDQALSKHGIEPLATEGKGERRWMLLDYADVIVHIFLEDVREFYGLERLWGDAPKLELGLPGD